MFKNINQIIQIECFFQSALLDLLGGSDLSSPVSADPTGTISIATAPVTNNNDLLDLLGGLDLTSPVSVPTMPQQQSPPQIFSPTSASNYLVDGLLNSSTMPIQNGMFYNLYDSMHLL